MIGAEVYAKERMRKLAMDVCSCLTLEGINNLGGQIEKNRPTPIPEDLADFYDCVVECRGYRHIQAKQDT